LKQTTVDALLIARTLVERATDLSRSDDRHLASAGLILIQDALEMAFYALLIELAVDEQKSLEGKSFDELIGELKKAGVTVPKSGTLKALNKQRVLTKHYAQVAEPITVRAYVDAALQALESIALSVIGRSLRDLFFADFLKAGPAKDYLKKAESLISEKDFYAALVEVRKAIFIEFEQPYCVNGWQDFEGGPEINSLAAYSRGGWKAHYWTRDRKWIEKNVNEPTDFIQIDFEQWRIDALEWGIHTAELGNLRRLTPPVFRADSNAAWAIKVNVSSEGELGTESNAKYCLDRAIAAILKKQEHADSHRSGAWYAPLDAPESYEGHSLRKKATSTSDVVHIIRNDYRYSIQERVTGFDGQEMFYLISGESKERTEDNIPKAWAHGYLQVEPGPA